MKTLKRVFLALLVVLASLSVACSLYGMSSEEAAKSIVLENTTNLTADFTLPTEVEGFKGTISWASDAEDIIKIEGNVAKVTCPEYTNGAVVTVKLTVTATNGSDTYSRNISVTVKQKEQNLASVYAETFTITALGSVISENFTLPVSDTFNEQNVAISWVSDNAAIVVDGQGNATVTRPAHDAEGNTTVKLTATITVNGATATKEFTATVLKEIYQQLGEPISTAPVAGTPYKWGMVQTSKGSVYYFTGEMNGYYGATTTEAVLGVDIYVETVEGGFHVYFNNASGQKQYVNGVASGEHLNFVFGDTAESVWTWNEECNSLVTKIGEKTCFPGTYGTYYTFGMCDMAEWNASSNYAGQFYVNDGSLPEPEMPEIYPIMTQPEVGVGYKLGIAQTSLVKLLYFTGVMDGYYGGASTDAADAVLVYLEEKNDGYYLSFTIDGTKNYVNLVQSGTYINVKFETTASTLWVWNAQYETLTTTIGSDVYYLGTYGTNKTFGASKISYAATSFVAHFYAADATEITDSERVERAEYELEKLGAFYDGNGNLELPTSLYGTTITWVTSDANVMTAEGVITPGATDQTVTLTATIALDGQESKTVELALTVKQVSASTLKEIAAAAIDANREEVLVKFVAKIVGLVETSNGSSPVFADASGALYSFAYLTNYAEGAKVGDVLEVVANVKIDWAEVQITSVIDSKVVEEEVTPVAVTELPESSFTSLEGLTTADIFEFPFHNKLIKTVGTVVYDGSKYYNVVVNGVKLSLKGISSDTVAAMVDKQVQVIGLIADANTSSQYWEVYLYGAEGQFVEYVPGEDGDETPTQTTSYVAKYTGTTITNMTADANNAETIGLDASIFNVTANKAGQSSNVGLNKNGTIRLYSDKNANGNELTITSEKTIVSITIEFDTTVGSFTVNGVAGSKDVTLYEINGNSVTIKNVQTGDSTQVHIKSITIVVAE